MIVIVDYGMGNLRSVEKGFHHVDINAKVVSNAASIEDATGIVVPGVGAFRDCMGNLEKFKLTETILKNIKKGKPFLGICMGLQILFSESMEFGLYKGLDVFNGRVLRFPEINLKIPHMGWNTINIKHKPPILEGITDGEYFYFVHSFYVKPDDQKITATTTDYGIEFTSMVWKDNVFATQFHPEKSQKHGLEILRNFGRFAGKA